MENKHLIWTEENVKPVLDTKIFSVRKSFCRDPEGETGFYSTLDAPDWVVIVPIIKTGDENKFIMVRQWRHGTRNLTLEFPSGAVEVGEKAEEAAFRELAEETAYAPGTLTSLAVMSPNPAIMRNHIHYFLAEELKPLGKQRLDEHEYVDAELIPVRDVVRDMGKPPYVHALMAAALMFYLRKQYITLTEGSALQPGSDNNGGIKLVKQLTNDTIFLHLKETSKDSVINEMIDRLTVLGKIKNRQAAYNAIMEREKQMSTGIKNGIAIPHGKTNSVNSLVACLGISDVPINFDSLDGLQCRIFIMTISRLDQTGPHLQFISEVSALLKNQEKRKAILNAVSSDDVLNILTDGD
jgi:mannitol/fructose-specific phosphotransferase system IIA component (Ntr-type)/8-oxo-dGTP pyrophosphatase MutT (NUDIX family)